MTTTWSVPEWSNYFCHCVRLCSKHVISLNKSHWHALYNACCIETIFILCQSLHVCMLRRGSVPEYTQPHPPIQTVTHTQTHTHTHTHAHKYTHTHTLYRCLVSVQSDFKPLPLTLTFHVLIHHHNHVLCRYKHITLVTSYSTAFRKPDIERVACLL